MFVDIGFEKGARQGKPNRIAVLFVRERMSDFYYNFCFNFRLGPYCLSFACVFGYRSLYRIERNDLVLIDDECVSHLNVDTLSHDRNMFAKGSRGIRISGVTRVAARVEVAAF